MIAIRLERMFSRRGVLEGRVRAPEAAVWRHHDLRHPRGAGTAPIWCWTRCAVPRRWPSAS